MSSALSALFSVVILCTICVLIPLACNEKQCGFTLASNLSHYTVRDFYQPEATWLYAGYVTTLAIVTASLPFGRKMKGLADDFVYTMNGPFSLVASLCTGILLEISGISVCKFIIDNRLQLTVASIICGTIFGLFMYLKSFFSPKSRLNKGAEDKSVLYGIVLGREINPRIFNLDVKMFLLRLTLISTILIECAYIYDSLQQPFNPTLVLLSVMHLIYIGDGLIYEEAWLSSFEIQYESYGLLLSLGYFVWPVIPSAVIAYIAQHDVRFEIWQLTATAFVFSNGYFLYRASNNQKDTFRRNPKHHSVAHLDSIKTSRGKNLLVSGYWGFVRHPNYLGDILVHLSIFPIFLNCPLAVLSAVSISLLLQRTIRDNDRCRANYGPDWDEYCKRVGYVLIPGIY